MATITAADRAAYNERRTRIASWGTVAAPPDLYHQGPVGGDEYPDPRQDPVGFIERMNELAAGEQLAELLEAQRDVPEPTGEDLLRDTDAWLSQAERNIRH